MVQFVEFGRYTHDDFKKLFIRLCEEMPSDTIQDAVMEVGQDEFNNIADAVERRLEKENQS